VQSVGYGRMVRPQAPLTYRQCFFEHLLSFAVTPLLDVDQSHIVEQSRDVRMPLLPVSFRIDSQSALVQFDGRGIVSFPVVYGSQALQAHGQTRVIRT